MDTKSPTKLSRRRFLQCTGLAASAAFLAACPQPTGSPAGDSGDGMSAEGAADEELVTFHNEEPAECPSSQQPVDECMCE